MVHSTYFLRRDLVLDEGVLKMTIFCDDDGDTYGCDDGLEEDWPSAWSTSDLVVPFVPSISMLIVVRIEIGEKRLLPDQEHYDNAGGKDDGG